MNNKKTDYIVFDLSKIARPPSYPHVKRVNMGESLSVRYLAIILDNESNLKKREIKRILSRMARIIKSWKTYGVFSLLKLE